jgi:hypothetical protein
MIKIQRKIMAEFKVGDWIRVFGRPTKIVRINDDFGNLEYYNTLHGNYRDGCLNPNGIEEYSPRQGEWVYVVVDGVICLVKYDVNIAEMFVNHEPFTGELPSFAKERILK